MKCPLLISVLHFTSETFRQWVIFSWLLPSPTFMSLHSNVGQAFPLLMSPFTIFKLYSSKPTYHTNQRTTASGEQQWQYSDKCLFFPLEGQTNMDALYWFRSTITLNIWMYGCTKQVFLPSPFDGPYSFPPLCRAQLARLSVVTTSPFNAPDRGLFAPIYVFSPITPWQAGGCQATPLRCWWSPLWLVLPASCTIFFIFFRFY